MKKRNRYRILLISVIMSLVLINVHSASSGVRLFLTGVVKGADTSSGTITMYVKSDSCHGTRRFTVDDVAALDGLAGAELSFYIDSSTCKADETYKIDRVMRVSRDGQP